jgi:hypothetical protein
VSGPVIVRVLFSHDRGIEAERELSSLARRDCRRQGSSPERLFEFSSREDADLFAVSAQNTPGVVCLKID